MIRRSGALALLIAALACVPAAAAPVEVNVRIEGIHKTLFDGKVLDKVHKVNGSDGTGKHKCDGTNGGANATPAPTLFGAFDLAVHKASLTWTGKWSSGFQDFGIDRVGPDKNDTTGGRYWGQALNFKDTQLGGCQIQVKKGDHVLIAYNSFGHAKLKLKGPKQATAGKAFQVTVLNGENGKPFQGASVRGKTTDAQGHAKVTFAKAGKHRLKARAKDAIRSNALKVNVG
jgi:hypothetical protein